MKLFSQIAVSLAFITLSTTLPTWSMDVPTGNSQYTISDHMLENLDEKKLAEIRDPLWAEVLDARQNKSVERLDELSRHFGALASQCPSIREMGKYSPQHLRAIFLTDQFFSQLPISADHAVTANIPHMVAIYHELAESNGLQDLSKFLPPLCSDIICKGGRPGTADRFTKALKAIPNEKQYDFMYDGLAFVFAMVAHALPKDQEAACSDQFIALLGYRESLPIFHHLFNTVVLEDIEKSLSWLPLERCKALTKDICVDRRFQFTYGMANYHSALEETLVVKGFKAVEGKLNAYMGGAQVTDDELVSILFELNRVKGLVESRLSEDPKNQELLLLLENIKARFSGTLGRIQRENEKGTERLVRVMTKMISLTKPEEKAA